ncbi:MAG: 6-phosphofructokinase [Clostridia bacterium]|nr:6-phosphofructokinase [Clostridia bacterium]
MQKINTIGVLTSGGDAPGMNAAVRAVVRTAKYYGMRVMTINKGYLGLVNGYIKEAGAGDVSDIINRGGTILQTARCPEFKEIDVIRKAITVARSYGIEGLVVIGGDGSFRGAKDLSLEGMPTIGIPGTIDNDIACSDYTIGFDTAINTAMQSVDKLRDTSSSHRRCNVVEVMGRNSGMIALNVAIATGAEAVLIPEMDFDLERDLIKPLKDGVNRHKSHFIIIKAEGFNFDGDLENTIQEMTGVETRTTKLGHVQRGGSPTVKDRVISSQLGSKAVELLKEGIGNRVVAVKNDKIYDVDIVEALNMKSEMRHDILDLSKVLSI